MGTTMNTRYFQENRGIAKVIEIVLGFVLCSLLCTVWYGGEGCFFEGRVGFASTTNFIILVMNIIFFILNLIDLHKDLWKVERVYATIAAVFFLVAAVLIVWYVVEFHNMATVELVVAAILVVVEFLLLVWEVRIMQGRAAN